MKKILVIEDDLKLQQLYQEYLVTEGIEVVVTDTVKEALVHLKSFFPDLIILDIMLPGGMNGFDFLEQIKRDEQYKKIPVWVMTNLDSERKTALSIGAAEYIIKANTPIEEVVRKIKGYLKPLGF